jgi:glycosyltransferase involved in cell wall biosynthesis
MAAKTQILLATYNGGAYLEAQLKSILDQTYTDWEILARDDGSTDSTPEILENFKEEHPERIKIIEDGDSNLGACGNFARLMEQSTAETICFADQDDIWHPDKMEKSIKRLKEIQNEHGKETPVLVHHDYGVIDSEGNRTSESFEARNNTGKDNSSLNHVLVQAIVYGFAMTANRALIEKSLPLPDYVAMHDTHLTFVAETFGKVAYMPEQLADYRIHGKNVIGGTNKFYNMSGKDFSLKNVFNGHSYRCVRSLFNAARETLNEKCANAASFLQRYNEEMPPEKRRLFEDFSQIAGAGFIKRKRLILQNRFLPTSKKLALAFCVLG